MKSPITEQKNSLRREYREKRRSLSNEQKQARDSAICRYIIDSVSFRFADHILMYAPTANEIDIMPVAEEAIKRGKTVYFPVCNTIDNTMTFRSVSNISQLVAGHYGIMAPPEDAPAYTIEDHGASICLVPGLIYDRHGYRIGYGKGYYDRFLAKFNGCKAGIVYSDFIIPTVPRDRFDCSVDIMITERNVKAPLEN